MTPTEEWRNWRKQPWSTQKRNWALAHNVISLKDFSLATGITYDHVRRHVKRTGIKPMPYGNYSVKELCLAFGEKKVSAI